MSKRYASQKFHVGQSVHLTAKAVAQGLVSNRYPWSHHGDVMAIQDPFRVKIRPLGRKTANWYHSDFWTPCRKREICVRLEMDIL